MSKPATNIYVDGFNLYYRAIKGTRYKWLDISKLCKVLFPDYDIHRIRYFTARVRKPADKVLRQRVLLRALKTIPNLSLHYGHFKERKIWKPRVAGQDYGELVEVWIMEEKGSDVNLASHLLLDGFRNDFEQAVVISNDSDLAEPVRIVRDGLKLPVIVVNPNVRRDRPTPERLIKAATDTRNLRKAALASSQFPEELIDSGGQRLVKPSEW